MTRSSRSVLMRSTFTALALLLAAGGCARSENGGRERTDGGAGGAAIRDGLYPVLWEASDPDSAAIAAPGITVLPYDRKYTGSGVTEPRTYVAVDTTRTVPLILEAPPEARSDGSGRSLLSVTLAGKYVKPLEIFTAEQMGRPVAILLDGEVVTMHKVRAVIREGKLQITRCDDHSCDVLRSRLMD